MTMSKAWPARGAVPHGSGSEAARHDRPERNGAAVRLQGVSKSFGGLKAVDDVSLDIAAGSFVSLLGPSGSGKTTTLNLIAGFIAPDAGRLLFDGKVVSTLPPHKRDIGMVFQSYALFPHMSVFDNVAYPLRMRTRLRRDALRARVEESLELVRLSGKAERYPRQLSGGQQQRVSMARALVSRPRLLLMTSRSGRSTRSCAKSSRSRSATSIASSARPSSTSPTTKGRP